MATLGAPGLIPWEHAEGVRALALAAREAAPWTPILLLLGCVGLYGLVLVGAEALRARGIAARRTRSLAHLLGGLASLPLPLLFADTWAVIALAATFGVLFVAAAGAGRLRCIFGARSRLGACLFPLAPLLCWLLARDDLPAYACALLALAIADPLAALVGCRWPRGGVRVWGSVRSPAGSLACAVAAAALAAAVLGPQPLPRLLLLGALVALAEAAAPWGTDNLAIPLVVLAGVGGDERALATVAALGLSGLATGLLWPLATARPRRQPAQERAALPGASGW